MNCAIAIFAKTIGLSGVKTRLAAGLGTANAEVFYKLSVEATQELVADAQSKADVHPYWVLAEEAAPALPQWGEFPAFWTGEGDLGRRIANVSETLFEKHDAVMLIGTDSPQLTAAQIVEAVTMLKDNREDCIVGPADDGGFYLHLVGKPIPREVWESVTYSQETTLAQLTEKVLRKHHFLATEQDVDVESDLAGLQASLSENVVNLLPAQKALLEWLNNR